jgi:hypothetical protein
LAPKSKKATSHFTLISWAEPVCLGGERKGYTLKEKLRRHFKMYFMVARAVAGEKTIL